MKSFKEFIFESPEDEITSHVWSEEGQRAFTAIADAQRDEPEHVMLDLQRVTKVGLLGGVSEHLGDILHRMTDKAIHGPHTMAEFGLMDGLPKVKRIIRELRSGYGYARDVDEETTLAAKYHGIDETVLRGDIDAVMNRYADAHAKLPVYNFAQRLARDSAVSWGRKDFNGAAERLEMLHRMMLDKETWREKSTHYNPNYEKRSVDMISTRP